MNGESIERLLGGDQQRTAARVIPPIFGAVEFALADAPS
jgi:hypothetical protein